jgi:hypothetical protein
MKFRLLILTAAAVVCTAGPALAQSQGTGSEGGSTSSAGGSSVSGGSSSSASVQTSGGANAGVVQGNVAEGSTTSGSSSSGDGSQSGAANSGDSVSGQVAGADAPSAVNGGVVSQLDIPAVGTVSDAVPASRQGPDVLMWGAVALVVAGLAVLYRRLPRPTRA